MKVEEGKFYRNRNGHKVGPMRATDNSFWPMKCGETWWRANGESCEGSMSRMIPGNDIVAEWIGPPVRMRPEIVPGIYGVVHVDEGANTPVVVSMRGTKDPAELTAAIETLTAIRDALAEAA